MPPTGPRSRGSQPAQPPQRGANVRNEAFESIFGRPAGNHHGQAQGPPGPSAHPGAAGGAFGHATAGPSHQGSLIPGPPPGGAYGYPPQRGPSSHPGHPGHPGHPHPSQGANGAYMPHSHVHGQPAFPPAAPLGPSVFAPQPQQQLPLPRGAPSFPPPRQQGQPSIPQHHQPHQPMQFQGGPAPAIQTHPPGQARGEGWPGQGYGGYAQATERPDRRASLAPSTYSTHSNSTASFYSPTPGATPDAPSVRRMPSGSFPNGGGSGGGSIYGQNLTAMTPAQAYQAQSASSSTSVSAAGSVYGGGSVLPSPASGVFPHRSVSGGSHVSRQGPYTADGSSGVGGEIGMAVTTPDYTSSGAAAQRRPTLEMGYGSAATSTAQGRYSGNGHDQSDYLRSLDNLSIDDAGRDSGPGMLGDIPGIPKRGDESPTVKEFSSLAARFSGEYGRDPGSSSQHRPETRHSTTSNASSLSYVQSQSQSQTQSQARSSGMHRRMASDSSIASSSGYTMRNMTALSQINPSPSSPTTWDATSPDTPTGSESGYASALGRKSVDSTQSLPLQVHEALPPGAAPGAGSVYDARATSFSGSSTSRHEALSAMRTKSVGPTARRPAPSHTNTSINFPSPHPSSGSLSALVRTRSARRAAATSSPNVTLASLPTIYPALLSKVAEVFRQVITLSENTKDGLEYKDSFDGRTAVTVLTEIIRTSDRNLALLLGRALDAQKMFHDVTYDHRLRDNPNEVYQFRERLAAPYMPGAAEGAAGQGGGGSPSSEHVTLARNTSSSSTLPMRRNLNLGPGMSGGPGHMASTPESTSLQMSHSHSQSQSASGSGTGSMSESQFSFSAQGSAHGVGSNSTSATPATSMTSLPAAGSPTPASMLKPPFNGQNSGSSIPTTISNLPIGEGEEDEDDLPIGVFTPLADCYSPTCTKANLCYSITCPRRMEQMKRLNMKPTGLTRSISHESLKEVKETGTLWIHSVSAEILASTSDTEKKRQEAINEVIYTERDFVRDLEYLKESWVKPLLTTDVISTVQTKREDFVRQVFWNVHDVWSANHPLAERLTKRQKQQPVVERIGDLFLERIGKFEPFVKYGAHQLFGKWEFEKEKGANPAFQKFVDETERKPESRKLELNGYLTKPTTRLGRYPLLLGAVLKYTDDDNPDKKDLEEAIKAIKAFLTKVNEESGKSENIFELAQLEGQLVFRPSEHIDLRLRDKSRELVNKGPLKRRGGNRDEIADLMGFLFDHAFLLVKPKYVNKAEQLRVYRRPIPLELLVVITPDESYNGKLSLGRGGTGSRLIAAAASSRPSLSSAGGHSGSSHAGSGDRASGSHVPPKPDSKHGYSITIVHLGRKGYSMQLWVDTYVGRKKWLEAIDKQQLTLRDRSCVFVTESISEGFFHGLRRINCISPYDNGNRMIYGTDEGVYFSNLRDPKLREPVKVINLVDVTQVDVIEDFQLLVVLHERSVSTFPLDCLDPNDPNAALKRGKRISSHTSFFKTGICLGKMLVAVVKSSTLSSTIKVLEPVDQAMRGKKQQGSFMKRLNGGNEALKLFKEFYIPTESSSVHFLKTKLCVGCTKGFEIVDLETLDMQGLLDPSDQSLDFVLKRDNVRPIAIYRIEEDFLLCYDEFAFYVNKNGWRSKPRWAIIWEGVPTAFALQFPFVIAFEPTFVEVRSVLTGDLVQVIPGNNMSCLFADTPPSRVNAASAPNRQMMFTPGAANGAGRPPAPGSGYTPGFPSRPGFMPPPQQPPAQPQQTRFMREQIIFTSDDGHVQFLKLPQPLARRGSSSSLHPSQSHAGNGMSMTMMQPAMQSRVSLSGQPPLPPQAPPMPMPMPAPPVPPQPYAYQAQPPQHRGPPPGHGQGYPQVQQQPVYGGHPGHMMGHRGSR